MIVPSSKNPNSYLTAKEREKLSFPSRILWERGCIKGRTLDFGSGLGTDVAVLASQGVDITGYDPHYAPTYPLGQFDTIVCHYVLNVLLPEEQVYVLMAVSELLKPSGRAYFAVRRDIAKAGFRTHAKHGQKVYQCNVVLPYKSLERTKYAEIYEYRHINQLTGQETADACPFCHPTAERELLSESATVYAILDKYPVSEGHALVIPKQHVADYFQLSERSKTACWLMVDRVKWLLSQRFQPDGFNVGINVGTAAGQTIPHVHIHVIPRYVGDTPNPTGGVRHVIAGKGDYFDNVTLGSYSGV